MTQGKRSRLSPTQETDVWAVAGLNHNFGTGHNQTNFGSKSIGGTREGLMLGIGFEVSLNGDTCKRLASQCTIITVP